MNEAVISVNAQEDVRRGQWVVWFFQILFVAILLVQLDEPFLSAHNERQNETLDMAQHVFNDGWRSVLTPKVSYSGRGFETRPYTPMLMEFPFHGVIGKPLVMVTGHPRAVVRVVSAVFAVASIQLMYWVLLFWLPAGAAALGAGVWAMAPFVLQFGQVPMPDILSTAGMLAAFGFALRGRVGASSASFLFTLLAKVSTIAFGLPVLVALWVARNCRTRREFVQVALAWGLLPLCGIGLWEFLLNYFSPPTEMTIKVILLSRGSWKVLAELGFYKFLIGSLGPMGIGVLGFAGWIFALAEKQLRMNGWIKGAIGFANLFFLVTVVRTIPEPQYLLPILAWCVVAAAFGFDFLLTKWRESGIWRMGLAAVVILQVLGAIFFTIELKASRVPNYPSIERVAAMLPPDARVLVLNRFYGASPAIWLNRNVISTTDDHPAYWYLFPETCDKMYAAGFRYLLILDTESWHDKKTDDGPMAMARRVWNVVRGKPASMADNSSTTGVTGVTNPLRQYCDLVFTKMFEAPRVRLYSMETTPEKRRIGEKTIWPGN